MTNFALAIGICTKNKQDKIIEAYYPQPILHPSDQLVTELRTLLGFSSGQTHITVPPEQLKAIAEYFEQHDQPLSAAFSQTAIDSEQPVVLTSLESDSAPTDVATAFLKLHLISHRLIKPHDIVLDGIFGILHNIAWTNMGPVDLPELMEWQIATRLRGQSLQVYCVDKFPKMVDYVVPSGIRIAVTARVRLGAYLGEGTTIMHEGFVNFNAGTLGTSMVEGRISAGVIVADGSDVGGGASIMGTLSGGGKEVISIGEKCLLGANSGTGISLGDRCTLEAGLYITSGTKITVLDENRQSVKTVKARELSGQPDLLFIRDSMTGAVQCLTNKSTVALNSMLHSND